MTMQILRGIAVSPGVAIGPPWWSTCAASAVSRSGSIVPEAVAGGFERLDRGLALLHIEAEAAETEARERIGPQYADILAAHARMISDPTLRRDARARVERDLMAAEDAVSEMPRGRTPSWPRTAHRLHLAARAPPTCATSSSGSSASSPATASRRSPRRWTTRP